MEDNWTETALSPWIFISSSLHACGKNVSQENVLSNLTGASVDSAVSQEPLDTVPVKLVLGKRAIWTVKSHIQDVAGNGNCVFHALLIAATDYGGLTALGTALPSTSYEARLIFIQFLRARRTAIERQYTSTFGGDHVRHYLWSDIPGLSAEEKILPNARFEELCESLKKSGIRGH